MPSSDIQSSLLLRLVGTDAPQFIILSTSPVHPIALQSKNREEELACLTRDNSSHILPTLLLTATT